MLCPRCREDNPERARFCLNCGAPLNDPAGRVTEERKVVTVLFADLVGFTAHAHQADPEDVRAILSPYYARLKEEIERKGGVVEKFIGDAVVGVFGAPTAHEDDAERAVGAGLAIVEALESMGGPELEPVLAVRIGITTGEAVVTLHAVPEMGEGIVAGDVVNTAARLQQTAPAGAVVVGESTYRSTRDLVSFEALPPVKVKGKPSPLHVWRALGARSRPTFDLRQRGPFVGRQHELALLNSVFARSVSEHSVQLVTLIGEHGVGKSRVVAELGNHLDAQPEIVFWRQGHCPSYGESITFWALSEIVKAHAGVLESDPSEAAEAKLEHAVHAVVEDATERDWFRTRLAPLAGVTLPESSRAAGRQESFTAWRRFLEHIALRHPLVLVVENLQWADPALVEFLEHLLEWSTAVPMLLLCTARPEFFELHPRWGGGLPNSTTIALKPLTGTEMDQLLSALALEMPVSESTRDAILSRAGGNPLYAEGFIRMLQEHRTPGRERTDPQQLPDTVQALISARLDGLNPRQKTQLQDAAVFGDTFWVGAIGYMEGVDRAAVERELHDLVRKGILRPARKSSMSDESEYSFWHPLMSEVAYGQLPRLARARKHKAAAQWLESASGDPTGDGAELIAHHFRQALHYARIARAEEEARALEGRASRYLILAGDRAMQFDAAEAAERYRQALELLSPEDSLFSVVLAQATEARWISEKIDIAEAERDYERAFEGLVVSGNSARAGEVLVKLAGLAWERGDSLRARSLLEQAVTLLEQEPPGRELAFAYTQTAGHRWASVAPDEAVLWADKALSLAERLHLDDQVLAARAFRGCARYELGDAGGLDDLRAALRIAEEAGLGRQTAVQYNALGQMEWLMHGPARGLEVYEEGIAFCERRGLSEIALWMHSSKIECLYDAGAWDETLQVSRKVMQRDRSVGGTQAGVFALMASAQISLWRGDGSRADGLVDRLVEKARATVDAHILGPALTVAGLQAFRTGHHGTLQALTQELLNACSEPGEWWKNLGDTMRMLVAAGALDEGEMLLRTLDGRTTRLRNCKLTASAILAEARHEFEAALQSFDGAAHAWGEYGHRLEEGQAHLGSARCLMKLSRLDEAAEHLEGARNIFAALGTRALLEEVDHLSTQLHAPSGMPTADG